MLGVAAPAAAVPIQFGFTGFITEGAGLYATGTPISGSYVFESETPRSLFIPTWGAALYDDAVTAFTVTVGADTFELRPKLPGEGNYIEVFFDSPQITIDRYVLEVPTTGPGANGYFLLLLWAPKGSGLITSVDLPLVPPDLSLETEARFAAGFEPMLEGRLTSLFDMPEPSTAVLLGSGLALAAALRRRYDSRSL